MLSVILTSFCHTTVIVFHFKVVFLCLLKKYLQLSECYNWTSMDMVSMYIMMKDNVKA